MRMAQNILGIIQFWLVLALFQSMTGCATSERVLKERQVDADRAAEGSGGGESEPKYFAVGAELRLDELIDFAVANSPDLQSIYARWKAFENQVAQAAALPDPKLSYGYFIESVQTKTGAQEQTVALSQTLPWFGKLSLKERMAVKQAESVAQEYDAAIRGLVSKLKKSYYEYAWLHDAVQINREHVHLLKVVESVASIRFKSGQISQSSLIQIQVEQGKIEDRIKELESLKKPLSNALYAALGVESGELLPPPVSAGEVLIDLDSDELKRQMEQMNPELKRISILRERQELAVRLASKDYYPDVTLGLSYIDTDGGKDPTLALVSINLPIWRGSLDAAKLEAMNRRQSVSEALRNSRLELGAQLDLLVYYYQNALRKNLLYENTLIPKAQQAIDLAVKGFETGGVGFADLLNAERTLLEFQLDAKRHAADAAQRLAEVDALAGTGVREVRGER